MWSLLVGIVARLGPDSGPAIARAAPHFFTAASRGFTTLRVVAIENHIRAIAPYFLFDDVARIHRTLRVMPA